MDRNTIGNEIEAEINASYRYKNLRELIDILLSVIILKTGKKELVGIEERLYVSLGKIFDGETTINDIKLCLSNVIKIEPLLKKMILLIDEDEYETIKQKSNLIKEKNYLISLLSELDIKSFSNRRESLEDYFMKFYKENKDFKGALK